jgi:ectoine hydroxylase-related dioxygenase (phytanoyl-CoA dioxygenase family)
MLEAFQPVTDPVGLLKRDGYLVLKNHLDPEVLRTVYDELSPHFEAAPFGTGAFYGGETKRFGRALSRSRSAASLVLDPAITDLVGALLLPHCERLQLNLTQGIEIHPGAPAQGPHRDHDMWGGSKVGLEYMVNVMWALDDFTCENGATRVWPRSNHMLDLPFLPEDEAVVAAMPAGSACLFLGSTLHSGGANRTQLPRRGLIISYCLGWLKPWENQWLAYPPHVASSFAPELAALVGYQQHLPSLGNFEGQCPSVLLNDDQRWTPFVDSLRPEQSELVQAYRAMQLEPHG